MKGLAGTLGEKIELGRVVRFETTDGLLDGYKHIQNERGIVGVLVELGGVDPATRKAREVAHDIALHIASAAPRYVSPRRRARRRRRRASATILEAQTRDEGKPEQALGQDRRRASSTGSSRTVALLEQPFVKDPKTTIGALVDGLGGGRHRPPLRPRQDRRGVDAPSPAPTSRSR